jgi:hypothetical protein
MVAGDAAVSGSGGVNQLHSPNSNTGHPAGHSIAADPCQQNACKEHGHLIGAGND